MLLWLPWDQCRAEEPAGASLEVGRCWRWSAESRREIRSVVVVTVVAAVSAGLHWGRSITGGWFAAGWDGVAESRREIRALVLLLVPLISCRAPHCGSITGGWFAAGWDGVAESGRS